MLIQDLTLSREVTTGIPGFNNGEVLLPSEDGSEVYVFNATGRHLRTLNGLTGAVIHDFAYDAQLKGHPLADSVSTDKPLPILMQA